MRAKTDRCVCSWFLFDGPPLAPSPRPISPGGTRGEIPSDSSLGSLDGGGGRAQRGRRGLPTVNCQLESVSVALNVAEGEPGRGTTYYSCCLPGSYRSRSFPKGRNCHAPGSGSGVIKCRRIPAHRSGVQGTVGPHPPLRGSLPARTRLSPPEIARVDAAVCPGWHA